MDYMFIIRVICRGDYKIMDKKKIMNWIIAIIVAIVYLTVSIIFKAWIYTWLIWVVYAIYRFIEK